MTPSNVWDMQTSLRALYTLCIEPVCQNYDITRTELDILLFLANNPKYDTAAEISDIRHLVRSHVSTSLKSLEAKGYVIKTMEDKDKRRVHLKLTKTADNIIREGQIQQAVFTDIITNGLDEEEQRQFHIYMLRMEQNIKKYLEEHTG